MAIIQSNRLQMTSEGFHQFAWWREKSSQKPGIKSGAVKWSRSDGKWCAQVPARLQGCRGHWSLVADRWGANQVNGKRETRYKTFKLDYKARGRVFTDNFTLEYLFASMKNRRWQNSDMQMYEKIILKNTLLAFRRKIGHTGRYIS